MKIIKTLLPILFITFTSFGKDVIVNGTIGKYPIEISIEKVEWETGELTGKYRYANKNSYLALKGEVMGSCVFLQEFYHDEETGQFYLEYEEDALSGKWIAGEKSFPARIEWTKELEEKLKYKQIEDYKDEVNNSITGTYKTATYFLNDMWFTAENPSMEIGFNGGTAMIEEIHPDTIHFLVEVICGPTYHIAYAHGKAERTGENTYYCLYNSYDEDTCELFFDFGDKTASVYAKSTNSFACEFGARAYLEHDFGKVDDNVDFSVGDY